MGLPFTSCGPQRLFEEFIRPLEVEDREGHLHACNETVRKPREDVSRFHFHAQH